MGLLYDGCVGIQRLSFWSSYHLDFSHVGVSKAILEGAGQNVEAECSVLGKD